ncbi:MAG: YdbH domain-containing protein, partial [Desulfobacterales bacterium]|nr:YdbH domain-containing protein [Desulfobacterales bacterium]
KSSLSNGKLRHRKNKITVEGIQMNLWIPDLIKMRSAPGQKLKFARASIGDMNIENGDIDFQIESARSVLIEKSHFNWCEGKVDAPAIRFKSGTEDYSLILYCDRLNLAKVLEQFGAASVEAEGELNGRIPLRYKNGQLSFQDGFLFTTPGEPGKIRMTDTEILTAGIPQDTPQYVQMELARKALEDYDYSWAKLNLTTEGDDLLLNLQLDGKPAKSLPFVYRKDIGGFAKVEADIEGSTFQGIRLDVNFRLPLNKLMQYKELIRMIQQSRE